MGIRTVTEVKPNVVQRKKPEELRVGDTIVFSGEPSIVVSRCGRTGTMVLPLVKGGLPHFLKDHFDYKVCEVDITWKLCEVQS